MTEDEDLTPVDIEIPPEEVVADEAKQAETPPAAEKKPAPDDLETGVADLKAQIADYNRRLEQERAARQDAERRAKQHEEQARTAQAEASDGRLTAISNAIRAVSGEAESAERAYADAMAAGDYQLAAKAQRQMAATEARLLQLENGKAALEERIAKPKDQPEIIPQPRQVDPIEEWADTLTPASASWVRQHKSVFADPVMARKIGAAHNAAVDLENLAPDTPEYFAYVEERIGLRQRHDAQVETPAEKSPAAPVSTRKPVPAAPVASGGSVASRSNPNVMTLSPEMREFAHICYPDLPKHEAEKKYAIDRAAEIRNGRITAQ